MPEETHGDNIKSLRMPSPETAEKLLRTVDCEQRLEASVYAPGLGSMPARILNIKELYDLLSGLPDFSVNFRQIQEWVGEVLGDKEVAAGIGQALKGRSEDRAKAVIADLLGERIAQCRAVLEVAEETRQGRAPSGFTTV